MSAKLEVGKTYSIRHSRFGKATVHVNHIDGEWVSTTVVKGRLAGITEECGPGDDKTIRDKHIMWAEEVTR